MDASICISLHIYCSSVITGSPKGALPLLINRYGYICFAQVSERVLTKSFVSSIVGNSKPDHLGAQGIVNARPLLRHRLARTWPLHDIAMTNIVLYI